MNSAVYNTYCKRLPIPYANARKCAGTDTSTKDTDGPFKRKQGLDVNAGGIGTRNEQGRPNAVVGILSVHYTGSSRRFDAVTVNRIIAIEPDKRDQAVRACNAAELIPLPRDKPSGKLIDQIVVRSPFTIQFQLNAQCKHR